jgi:hypothetical protein
MNMHPWAFYKKANEGCSPQIPIKIVLALPSFLIPGNPKHRTNEDAEHRRRCREHGEKNISCDNADFDRDIGTVEVQAADRPKRSRFS